MNDQRRYSAPRAFRREAWLGLGFVGLVTAGVDTLILTTAVGDRMPGVAAFTAPILVVSLVVARNWIGHTTVGPPGLATRNLLWRRRIPWERIASFEVKNVGSRTSVYMLCVLTTKGRHQALPGVVSVDRADPTFQARVAEIEQAWIVAR